MDPASVTFLGLLALVVGVASAGLRRGSRDDTTRRAFAKPIVKIAAVRNGTVVIIAGTVNHSERIPSYISGEACALFE